MAENNRPISRILLIDDDPVIRSYYQTLLRRGGWESILASSGEEAIQWIKKDALDLVIVDINLGGMDGLEVLKEAKRIDPDLEVIMITASATLESTLKAIQFGAFDFFIKTEPHTPEEILYRIEKAVHKRRLVRENRGLIEKLTQRERDLETRVRRMQTLLAFINSINASWNIGELMGKMHSDLCSVLGAMNYSIFMYDRDAQVLTLLSSSRAVPASAPVSGAFKGSLLDAVITRRETIVVPDYAGSAYSGDPGGGELWDFFTPGVISVPLFSGRRLIGVFNANLMNEGGESYTEEDVHLVSILGETLAATVHNHLLMVELKQKVSELDASFSQLKQTQAQLVQSEKLAALSVLVAGVAHEIRNPLNAMTLAVENLDDVLAAEDCPPPDAVGCTAAAIVNQRYSDCLKYAGIIKTETRRLKKLIDDFLDFTRPAGAKMEDVSVGEAIEAALQSVEREAAIRMILIVKRIDPDLPALSGDPHGFYRALVNLMMNAVQAMPKGGKMTVTARRLQGRLSIGISDTGVGIPRDNLSKIYDPFFTTKSDGVGLGLSLVHRTVRSMRGTIHLKSVEGRGTAFTLAFPVERSMAADENTVRR